MGTSTDAILFYGYCWTEDINLFDNDDDVEDDEWAEALLKRRGEVDPWDAFPTMAHNLPYDEKQVIIDAWLKKHEAELDAWRLKLAAVESEFPIKVGQHCSGECSMPYLAIKSTVVTASRGYPEVVTPLKFMHEPAWDEDLTRFMHEFSIKPPAGQSKPRWWLVSWWSQ